MGERSYGRGPCEPRPGAIEPGFVRTATGSALISVGETRVICTASAQESVPRWMNGQGRGWVTAEYGMPPASTGDRKQRDATRGAPGRAHDRDPAPDRALAARGRRLCGARRTHDLPRLRRPAGRGRHPLRVDHRGICRPRAGVCAAASRGPAGALAAERVGGGGLLRDHRRRPTGPANASACTSSHPASPGATAISSRSTAGCATNASTSTCSGHWLRRGW